MPTISYSSVESYTGHAIWVPVILHGLTSATTLAVLDTGASISVFNQGFAQAIGITDLHSGTSRVMGSASGAPDTAYIHVVSIEVWGRKLPVPIAFGTWNYNLLGMQGFFEQLGFGLDHGARRYYV